MAGTLRPQGTASDADGNIWIANYENSAVVVFPKGNPAAAVSYSGSAGGNANVGGFGMAIGPDGSAWVSDTTSATLMKYKLVDGSIIAALGPISLPDRSQPKGVAIDAKGNIWVATFGGFNYQTGKYGVIQLCGATPANCPPGSTTGSAISPKVGYTLPSAGDAVLLSDGQPVYDDVSNKINSHKPIMRQTNVQPDSAGNVWVMNNWKPSIVQNLFGMPLDPNDVPNPGGDGVVVIIGIGAPTKGPLIGPAQAP